MCTDVEAFRSEILSLIRREPDSIDEMCKVFLDVDTPEKLADFLEISQMEMKELMSAVRSGTLHAPKTPAA